MKTYPFYQVDVFGDGGFSGNPLAVLLDSDDLDDATMQGIAAWTGLSETTFISARRPQDGWRYGVRIFTQRRELPFAGHPTLGSCAAWLHHHGLTPEGPIRQETPHREVDVLPLPPGFAFKAPPLLRTGGLDPQTRARAARALRVDASMIQDTQWLDNGAGWCAVLLADERAVLALEPDFEAMGNLKIGVVAPSTRSEADGDFEVRAFAPSEGVREDPVTGNLQAGLAWWLTSTGLAPSSYVARQGTALGRRGRVHVRVDADDIWIGGRTDIHIVGAVSLDDLYRNHPVPSLAPPTGA